MQIKEQNINQNSKISRFITHTISIHKKQSKVIFETFRKLSA